LGDFVYLRGHVDTAGGAGTLVVTLPTGYRPAKTQVLPVVCSNASSVANVGRIEITAAGAVSLTGGDATEYLSLDGVCFSTVTS
jgi:hypothetical protein